MTTTSPRPDVVIRHDRAPLAAMGFFSFTRSKSSASVAAKKAPNPEDSWLHEAVIRFLQVRATFRAFSPSSRMSRHPSPRRTAFVRRTDDAPCASTPS